MQERYLQNDERHDSKHLVISIENLGREKFDITREMLITYLETGFSQRDIGQLFNKELINLTYMTNFRNILTSAILSLIILLETFCLDSRTLAFSE